MKFVTRRILFLIPVICFCSISYALDVSKITCEQVQNPLGIATLTPRFGWQLVSTKRGDKQTAYEIIVSSDAVKANLGDGDVWRSGKVESGESQWIVYAGKALSLGERYYWKVRVWDANKKLSSWSDLGFWEMAPGFSVQNVKWIGAITKENSKLPEGRKFHSPDLKKKEIADMWNNINPLAMRSIMLRKSFPVNKKVLKAIAYVSGLGHYELMINGRKVGASEFAPLWSDYDKTVYYNIYQTESLLTTGENSIGVVLGNGFYNVIGNRYRKLWVSFGPPTLFLQIKIQYADGSTELINADESWKYSESPITFNCIYGGEDYDARLEQPGWDKPGFNDATWKPVVLQESPKGILRPQLASPVQVMKQYDIKTVKEPLPGTYVLDMGQNLSGYPTLKVQGKKGQEVKLLVGELLNKDSTVNQRRSGAPYVYTYTLKGEGVEEWHPRFSYYGFQYIQVEGADVRTASANSERPLILDVKSNFIYNAAGETGTFECSNEIFNKAHVLIHNAVKSNWQSVFTDCPHREKLGWLEESYLNGPGLFYTYNLTQFIPKLMQDIADGQRTNGLVPSIIPEYVMFGGDFTDSPEWGVAAIVLPWMYYEYYGDKTLITKYYPVMKKYVDYLTSRSDNYIVSHGLGDWYDYGEHAAGYSKNSPIALSATSHYYYGATLVKKAAELLGLKDDVLKYEKLSQDIKNAYNAKFFNRETKQYATASQYSNAISLYLDLTNPGDKQAVLNNLVTDIQSRGNRLTTGDIGNRYLYQALAQNGRNDVMYAMHNHSDTPGYGFQIKFGLTTLTEQWDPRKGNSWNHFMMGQIDEWFYCSLAGIVADAKVPGFKHVIIQPEPVGDLTSVKSSIETLYGNVSVQWKKEKGLFTLSVKVPVNSTASVILPSFKSEKVLVNNVPVSKSKEVSIKNNQENKSEMLIGSGEYVIVCNYKE